MRYGIIGAMDEEIEYLQEIMTEKQTSEIANVLFIQGKIASTDVIVLKSGIGKVNAAMATTILIEQFKPTHIINTGSAGGFAKDLSVGDVVIAEEVVHHDVDVTAFDYEYGQVPKLPPTFKADEGLIEKSKTAVNHLHINSRIGLVATGDSFMSDPTSVKKVSEKFPQMLAAEMEGAAIAQVCFQYNIPFVIIRALSDIAGKESPMSFRQFLDIAAKNATAIIVQIIKGN